MVERIPAGLVAFWALAVLGVLALGWTGHGTALAVLILLATLSDIFDGIAARRLGVSTPALRRADSIVDLVFWLATIAALFFLRPVAMRANWAVIACAIAAE